MREMAASGKQRAFGRHKLTSLPKYCRECEVRFACHGECPRNRFINAPDGEPGLNLQDETASGESQLGTSDLQSLADLTNSVNVVRGMHLIPGGQRLTVELALCVLAPLTPLLLLKFPVDQMELQLFKMLAGL